MEAFRTERYGTTRFWAVRDATDTLVCLCVSTRGAQAVTPRLQALDDAQRWMDTTAPAQDVPGSAVWVDPAPGSCQHQTGAAARCSRHTTTHPNSKEMTMTQTTQQETRMDLTPDQCTAVSQFAQTHGRSWKSVLRQQWERVSASPILHGLRNSHGPAWLARYRLSGRARLLPLVTTRGGTAPSPRPTAPLHRRLLFVGEQRSRTAVRRGYAWCDKRLCARTLTEALEACGIAPDAYTCLNVFTDAGALDGHAVHTIRAWSQQGGTVIGLSRKVQQVFTQAGIPFRAMVHPAARGRIRQRALYQAHVAEVLQDISGAVSHR